MSGSVSSLQAFLNTFDIYGGPPFPWLNVAVDDVRCILGKVKEQELEIARLQAENAELRKSVQFDGGKYEQLVTELTRLRAKLDRVVKPPPLKAPKPVQGPLLR